MGRRRRPRKPKLKLLRIQLRKKLRLKPKKPKKLLLLRRKLLLKKKLPRKLRNLKPRQRRRLVRKRQRLLRSQMQKELFMIPLDTQILTKSTLLIQRSPKSAALSLSEENDEMIKSNEETCLFLEAN